MSDTAKLQPTQHDANININTINTQSRQHINISYYFHSFNTHNSFNKQHSINTIQHFLYNNIYRRVRVHVLVFIHAGYIHAGSPQVTGHLRLVGAFSHRPAVFLTFAHSQFFFFPFRRRNLSVESWQHFLHVKGQFSFTPIIFWHLFVVQALLTHLHDFIFCDWVFSG